MGIFRNPTHHLPNNTQEAISNWTMSQYSDILDLSFSQLFKSKLTSLILMHCKYCSHPIYQSILSVMNLLLLLPICMIFLSVGFLNVNPVSLNLNTFCLCNGMVIKRVLMCVMLLLISFNWFSRIDKNLDQFV